MQRETGTTINIEEVGEQGVIMIYGPNKDALDAAVARINAITFTPTVGDVYTAKVVSLQPYGVFVEFGGKSGLLHVSEISYSRIDKVEDVLKEGDEVKVKLVEIDKKTGKMRLSRKALMPKPEGYVEPEPRPERPKAASAYRCRAPIAFQIQSPILSFLFHFCRSALYAKWYQKL